MRAFAKRLQVSPSHLSEILNRKGRPSRATIRGVCNSLNISKPKSELFCDLQIIDEGRDPVRVEAAKSRIESHHRQQPVYSFSHDAFETIAGWYHLSILALMETEAFDGQAESVARRLRILPSVAQQALDRLERLGLIREETPGQYQVCQENTLAQDGISPEAMKLFHKQILDKAKQAIQEQSSDQRLARCTIFACAPEAVQPIRQAATAFFEQVAQINQGFHTKDQVHGITLQFFQISDTDSKPS